jgi:hypothetical protein
VIRRHFGVTYVLGDRLPSVGVLRELWSLGEVPPCGAEAFDI